MKFKSIFNLFKWSTQKASNMVKFLLLLSTLLIIDIKEIKAETTQYKQAAILIASKKGLGRSAFGHAYLRFSTDPKNWTDQDQVIEYVANIEPTKVKKRVALGLTIHPYHYKKIEQKYFSVRKEITILENRDLTTYPLSLTESQVQELYQIIQNEEINTNSQNYNYIANNCASEIARILSLVIKPNKQFKIIDKPYSLIDQFNNYLNPDQIINDLSANHLRQKLLSQFLQELKLDEKSFNGQIVTKTINSKFYSQRLFGIIYLSDLVLKEFKSATTSLFILTNRMALLEAPVFQTDILEFARLTLNGQNKLFVDFIPLFHHWSDYSLKNENSDLLNTKINYNSKKFEINLADQLDSENSVNQMSIPLSDFNIEMNQHQLLYDGNILSHYLDSHQFSQKLINRRYQTNLVEIEVNQVRYLLPFIVYEKQSFKYQQQNNPEPLKGEDLIPLTNFAFKQSLGNCYSLVLLQKRLIENTIFIPSSSALSLEENKVLFQDLIKNKFIIIPGFKNTRDWLLHFPESWLKDQIGQYSYQLNIREYTKLMKKYFTNVSVNKYNIQDLKFLTDQGLTIPITFKVEGKKAGHSLLISKITIKEDQAYFTVYDANFGLIDGSKNSTLIRFDFNSNKMFMGLYAPHGVNIEVDQDEDFQGSITRLQLKKYKNLENWMNKQLTIKKYSFKFNELPN